ncbi:TetR/AcrR family transcriptional regulator [Streptomyces sp. SL13]|uniref:TetR/AcrR family transcriptional regulator n=1 Tax=Streptantibioticus silvisoli TaxID=2705255 RepID=A0AA90H4J3_9ACTN|nr:TetR/AcrR family transcriptional regulator [Streptantibioticus silvisoli]MDI5971841.1 TetR/AcrR family transcriptional regulator [Streptantibioticus silvisoli]
MASRGPRMSAEERRESVVRAAYAEFARTGYHGTSTEAIARRVGVSQPYLFRLFPGKQALFRAAAERCFDVTLATFEKATEGLSGHDAKEAMAEGYAKLILDRDVLLMQMQLYVAAASAENPELSEFIRRRWTGLWDFVRGRTGSTDEELTHFFGTGMLINVLVSLGIPPGDRCWNALGDDCKIAARELLALTD